MIQNATKTLEAASEGRPVATDAFTAALRHKGVSYRRLPESGKLRIHWRGQRITTSLDTVQTTRPEIKSLAKALLAL